MDPIPSRYPPKAVATNTYVILPGSHTVIYSSGNADGEASTNVTVACPIPINFRAEGNPTVVTLTGGKRALEFNYNWDSSTGRKSDLSHVKIGELVTYPESGTTNGTFFWRSPPFPAFSNRNPVINDVIDGTDPGFADDNKDAGPGYVTPYQGATFTAVQYYRYKTQCTNNGDYVNLMGPINIVRTVSQNQNGTWQFTLTKSGGTLTYQLP